MELVYMVDIVVDGGGPVEVVELESATVVETNASEELVVDEMTTASEELVVEETTTASVELVVDEITTASPVLDDMASEAAELEAGAELEAATGLVLVETAASDVEAKVDDGTLCSDDKVLVSGAVLDEPGADERVGENRASLEVLVEPRAGDVPELEAVIGVVVEEKAAAGLSVVP
jgi:hypothetical protein